VPGYEHFRIGIEKHMAAIQLRDLKLLDNTVFGKAEIVRQSSKTKEAWAFIEKPATEHRKTKKAKRDNAIILQRQTVYQRSESSASETEEDENRIKSDFKYKYGFELRNGQSKKDILFRNWNSTELLNMPRKRKASSYYLDNKPKLPTLPPFTNEDDNFNCYLPHNSSLSVSASITELPSRNQYLSLSSRKSLSFHGYPLHSRECFTEENEADNSSSTCLSESSTEEENEVDNDSSTYFRESSSEEENEVDNGISTNKNCITSRSASQSRVSQFLHELLSDIYGKRYGYGFGVSFNRSRHSADGSDPELDYYSTSEASTPWKRQARHPVKYINNSLTQSTLESKKLSELEELLDSLRSGVQYAGSRLVRELMRRDDIISLRDKLNVIITANLQALSRKMALDTQIRFSLMPSPGDNGFTQWQAAMQMVARLPGGIPPVFRRRFWLTVAEKHLRSRSVDWSHTEKFCFKKGSNPDDYELGVQNINDLRRTGCYLFCGAVAEENQLKLKRLLLAYARWNKAVGYCQGFNMLAAVILQVMDYSETDSLKVMIYLIEGVLPESYFSNKLRGLSVDMAVFKDLLRLRLPILSKHLEKLQNGDRHSATRTVYEPPLTNVLTMKWFLTMFSTCLPHSTVIRIWDLIFLEGNVVLLRTALAIMDELADYIMAADRADKFYSIMAALTREMEFGIMDTDNLIKTIVNIAPFPFPDLPELRDKYLYNITPWARTLSATSETYSDDDDDDDESTDKDDRKVAAPITYRTTEIFRSTQTKYSLVRTESPSRTSSAENCSPTSSDKGSLSLDISVLKQQYAKLRGRRSQYDIRNVARGRKILRPIVPTPATMNHLQLEKSALRSVRCRRDDPPPANIASKSAPNPQRERQQFHIIPQGQLTAALNVKLILPQLQQTADSNDVWINTALNERFEDEEAKKNN
jgi:hypothetical protein